MKRLVCVVEGQGEVEAIPNLCSRILRHLGINGWFVDGQPVRQPRTRLVDQSGPSPNRPANREGLRRAVALAMARPADAVLVICDADDDCAVEWGTDAVACMSNPRCGAVMAIREFETWLLARFTTAELKRARLSTSITNKRDTKTVLRRLVPGYKPTTHQLSEARLLDIEKTRRQQPSFDKLIRTVERVCAEPSG